MLTVFYCVTVQTMLSANMHYNTRRTVGQQADELIQMHPVWLFNRTWWYGMHPVCMFRLSVCLSSTWMMFFPGGRNRCNARTAVPSLACLDTITIEAWRPWAEFSPDSRQQSHCAINILTFTRWAQIKIKKLTVPCPKMDLQGNRGQHFEKRRAQPVVLVCFSVEVDL